MKKWLSILLAGIMVVALAAPVSAVAARSITMGIGQITMTAGGARQMSVRWSPSDAAVENLTWRSSDESVAVVDSTGLIIALKRGEAIVSARSERGLKTSVRVTVRDQGQKIAAQGLEMLMDSLRMQVDQTRLLTAYFTPSDTTDQELVWASADPNIATVDPEGEVTAVAPGTTTITASSSNGQYATCTVTVSSSVLRGSDKDASVSQAQNSSETVTSAAARTAVEEVAASTKKSEVGIAVFKNKTKITPTVIGAAAYSAREAERDIRLRFRTETEAGKLEGYLTFDPQTAQESKKDIGVAVYNASDKVATTLDRSRQKYSNTLAAFQLSHTGSYGFQVDVVVKPTVSGLTASQLQFYSYSTALDRYKEIDAQNVRIDKSGYLHFTIDQGGVIVVSNGALKAK